MIELRHLRYFIAVAEELNFRRAAERIHIDQSPLSRTIADLERQLGAVLFVRTPRRLELTPAGVKLLAQSRSMFIRLERIKRIVREADSRYREPLRIGIDESMMQSRLAECFNRWRDVAPDISLHLTELRTAELLAALRSEEVDAGFSFGLPEDEAITEQPAWRSPVVAIVPSTHELAKREKVFLAELLAFPSITCHATHHPGLFRQMRTILQRHSVHPTIVGQARSVSGCLNRVAAGIGVGVADADHMEMLRRTDIAVVPLVEPVHITTYVLHKRRRTSFPTSLQRFLAHATSLH